MPIGEHSAVALPAVQGLAALRQALDTPDGPLCWAIKEGRSELVRALLDAGADPNQLDRDDNPPLFRAAANGDSAAARLLLEHGAAVDALTRIRSMCQSALMATAEKGHAAVARLLLERRAEVDLKDRFGRSA